MSAVPIIGLTGGVASGKSTVADYTWALSFGLDTKSGSEKSFVFGVKNIGLAHDSICGGYNSFTSAYAGWAHGYKAETTYNYSNSFGCA